jgi:hypothetical protein
MGLLMSAVFGSGVVCGAESIQVSPLSVYRHGHIPPQQLLGALPVPASARPRSHSNNSTGSGGASASAPPPPVPTTARPGAAQAPDPHLSRPLPPTPGVSGERLTALPTYTAKHRLANATGAAQPAIAGTHMHGSRPHAAAPTRTWPLPPPCTRLAVPSDAYHGDRKRACAASAALADHTVAPQAKSHHPYGQLVDRSSTAGRMTLLRQEMGESPTWTTHRPLHFPAPSGASATVQAGGSPSQSGASPYGKAVGRTGAGTPLSLLRGHGAAHGVCC